MGLLFLNSIRISRNFTYKKNERLKSRKLIEHLFGKGKSISVFPIKVLYDFVENASWPVQAGVTASSRSFKKAVQRNRVKRVMREAYRLQKLPLQQALREREKSLILFFIYLGKELPVFSDLHEKMKIILQKLSEKIMTSAKD